MSNPFDQDAEKRDPFNEGLPAANARKQRSLVIAIALLAFVVVVFAVTLIKLGVNAQHLVPQQ
jgi:hypothetical protein